MAGEVNRLDVAPLVLAATPAIEHLVRRQAPKLLMRAVETVLGRKLRQGCVDRHQGQLQDSSPGALWFDVAVCAVRDGH